MPTNQCDPELAKVSSGELVEFISEVAFLAAHGEHVEEYREAFHGCLYELHARRVLTVH